MSRIITSEQRSSTQPSCLTYTVYISKSGLREGNHIKQRLKNQYLQHYKDKLHLNSIIRVQPPCHDNLALLTTKQLDDYIQLQRNRMNWSALSHKRTHNQQPSSVMDMGKFKHTKIYRSSFLAKLNKIVGEQSKQKEKNQEYTQVNFTFGDVVVRRRHSRAVSCLPRGEGGREGEKMGMECPEEGEGEMILEKEKIGEEGREKRRRKTSQRTSVEWFEGMSRRLLKKPKTQAEPTMRGMDIDKCMNKTRKKFKIKSYTY